mmetsp:Transcript_6174/g.7664  ORF Transcript_6174/g.7664 Transcript_6174/m.7664 type:complete len:189 (+) Transcript_6174:96-662(+)
MGSSSSSSKSGKNGLSIVNEYQYGIYFNSKKPSCHCNAQHKMVEKIRYITINMFPSKYQTIDYVSEVGSGIVKSALFVIKGYDASRLQHDCNQFYIKCKKCNESDTITIEYGTNQSPYIRYGYYPKEIESKLLTPLEYIPKDKLSLIDLNYLCALFKEKGYLGENYNIIHKNCQHFAKEFWEHITQKF